jgi:type I restriction enzyme S subunit
MRTDWEIYKLEELTDPKRGISYGIVQPGTFLDNGGVPVLKVNNLTEKKTEEKDLFRVTAEIESKFSRTRLQGNEILVSLVGSIGHIHKVTKTQVGWNVVRAIGVLPIKKDVNRDWIYWSLKSPDVQSVLINNAVTTVQSTLNIKELKEIEISIPNSLDEQIQITSILSSLDNKIELNLQMNQTLEAMAQAIFKEWFVNFNFPGFDGELVDELPKGWRMGNIGNVLELVYGKALKAETRIDGDFPVIGSSGIVGFHNEFLVEGPGIVIGRKGTIGEVIWVDESFFPIDTTFYIKDLIGCSGLFYHYFLLKEQEFKKIISDSAVPGLNRHQAMSNEIAIPETKIINEFNSVIKSIFERKELINKEINSLTLMRDSLLPKLMTGKIEVKA